MTFKEKLLKALTPEVRAQVEDALGDDFDWDFVPRSRLNTVIAQRNDYKSQLESTSTKLDDDDDDDDDDLGDKGKGKGKSNKTKTKEPEVDVTAIEEKHKKEMADMKKRFAVTEKLREAQVRKPDLLLAQIDLEKVNDDLGNLDEIVKGWKESDPYLFEDTVPGGTGKDGGAGSKVLTEAEKLVESAFGGASSGFSVG